MKKGKRVWTCAVMLSAAFLGLTENGVSGLIPVQSVSAAAAVYSGTCGDVGWSFDRGSGTLTMKALKSGEPCSINLMIWNGAAYLHHEIKGHSIPTEEYCTPEWLVPWESYRDKIKTLILPENVSLSRYSGSESSYFQNLAGKIICQKADGYGWEYDRETDTLTFSGSGPLNGKRTEQQDGTAAETGYFSVFSNYYFLRPSTVVLSDGITQADSYPACSRLVIGKDAEIGTYAVREEYILDPDNPYYTVYDGSLYTKDCKKLLSVPENKADVQFHPNLEVLGSGCFGGMRQELFVIPWGVTTIERGVFSVLGGPVTFVLPDTLQTLQDNGTSRSSVHAFIFSMSNNAAMNGLTSGTYDHGGATIRQPKDAVSSYYGIKPGSWKTVGSRKWYIDEAGKMTTGTRTIGGKTYTFGADGVLLESGNGTGTAASGGFRTLNGETYYYVNGEPVTGVRYIDGKAYYFGDNGVMQKSGWVQTGYGEWPKSGMFYLNDSGAAVVNCWRLKDGQYCYLGADGMMVIWSWVKDYGSWYYVNGNGARCESTWRQLGGEWYWFGGSGKMAQSQWLKLGGKWYYFTGSGAMAANKWVKSGAYWYYLGSDGAMLTNTVTPDGYRVDAQGRWI